MLIVPLDENLETVVYLFPNPRIIKSTQIDVSTKYSNNKSRPHQSENSRNSPPTGGKDISIRPEVDSAKQQRLDPTFPPIHPFPRSIQQSRSNADFAIRKPSKSPTREGNGKRASVGIIIRVNVTRSGYRIGRRPIGEGCRALSLSVSGPGHGGSRVRARTRPYSRLAAQRIPRIRLSTVTRTNTLARGIRGYSGMDLLPSSFRPILNIRRASDTSAADHRLFSPSFFRFFSLLSPFCSDPLCHLIGLPDVCAQSWPYLYIYRERETRSRFSDIIRERYRLPHSFSGRHSRANIHGTRVQRNRLVYCKHGWRERERRRGRRLAEGEFEKRVFLLRGLSSSYAFPGHGSHRCLLCTLSRPLFPRP